ncbi:MAG TPA: ABC transporter permease [Methylomirabilota bacterium]|nr:ABC transporter permease [Methylomirabilota bacterium]
MLGDSAPPIPRRSSAGRLAVGGALVGLFAFSALLAPLISPYDPGRVPGTLTREMLRAPEAAHPFGTDALGRDVFSRVLHGGRVSLALGLGAEIVAAALGAAIGLTAGYYGGWRDSLLMRLTDVVMAFPSLILAIGLIAVFERPGLDKVALVLVALGWTTIARVVRGEVLSLKERDYIQAARALGVGHRMVLLRHLLPNAVGPLIVTATIGVGGNMIAEAGLSFLGLGAQAPTISWGSMLAEGQTFLVTAPWAAFFPGAALLSAVLGINLLGDALRDLLDPRFKP